MQEILYNNKLTIDQQHEMRGALHEIDQILLLPKTAKKRYEMGEKTGLKEVASKSN